MKKLCVVVLAVGSLAYVSCKKSSSSPTDPHYAAGMHATVNGTAMKVAYVNSETLGAAGDLLVNFEAADSSNFIIGFTLANGGKVAAHNLAGSTVDSAYYVTATDSLGNFTRTKATAGTVQISYIGDTVIEGTFNFTAGSYVVTNGIFNMSY